MSVNHPTEMIHRWTRYPLRANYLIFIEILRYLGCGSASLPRYQHKKIHYKSNSYILKFSERRGGRR